MSTSRQDVAIIGMACLFPGAADVDAYWRNILGKVDATSDPPPTAWDTDVYYDPTFSDQDKVYCKRGGYLGSLVAFDPLPHGIPPIAVGGEPDQWLALQLAKDAMADAGYATLAEPIRRRTAVILGKGTYLNGGNAIVVEHSLIIGQTLEIIKRLHPEYTPEQIEVLRREMKRALPTMGPETMPGLIPNVTVGRIANRLDLMGPTYTVDAACASSLVAVQLALRDLTTGECDLALVGGSQVWMPVPTLNVFCRLGALSRRQQIRPFDQDADGTLLGEGIGMVVLKRLDEAERDGDRIYAVIKGAGVASDGRGSSVMAPRIEGEELALRRAYDAAGVSPSTVGLIEAHGTATPVGDVVEVQALTRVFGLRGAALPHCALGTVKSMISHTIPAAGVAGLIKTALALHHKVLPPTMNCVTPNPKLEIEKTPFYLNTETRPWIHGGAAPRRAGVNAFGFGGINAHVVLEEYTGRPPDQHAKPPSERAIPGPSHMPPWESEVFLLTSAAPAGLLEQVNRLLRFLDSIQSVAEETGEEQSEAISLKDLAFSVNCGGERPAPPHCLAVVATSLTDLRQKLARAVQRLHVPNCRQIKDVTGIYYAAQPLGREGKLAFLFPGEGAQYPHMLADLCLHFPEVRECFDRSDRIFTGHPRGYLPSDYIFPRPAFFEEERRWAERHLMQMDCAIEAVLTANQAVLTLLRQLGLRPDVCVGHSTGEYSAMAAAGILDLNSEERLVDFSRRLNQYYEEMAAQDGVPRAMLLAVGAERDQVEAIAREAGGAVYLAMDNCPHQAVLVGEQAAVERALDIVRREGLIYEQLSFDRAYHTPLFAPYADPLKDVFAEIPVQAAHTPIYSCTTAARYPVDPTAIRALIVEHWASAVEFRRTISALHADGVRLFVEVGPRGNLSAFIEDVLRGRSFCAVPANVQRRSGITQLNHLVGLLATHGVPMDLAYLYGRRQPRRIEWEETASNVKPFRSASRIALATGWPMLRLPADIGQQLQPDQSVTGTLTAALTVVDSGTAHPLAAPTPSAPLVTTVPAPASDVASSSPETAEAAWPLAAASAGATEAVQLPLSGAAEPNLTASPMALDAYFGTMDQFLAVQQHVMETYLLGPARSGDAPVAPSAADSPYPLLGSIITWQDGEQLVAQRTVDLAEDRYLRDHTLGRTVSLLDEELTALALMPLTMSIEMLAEAAACLLPEQIVVGLREVRAHRWLAWDDQPQTLQVTARRLPGGLGEAMVSVQLRNLTEDSLSASPQRNPVLEATVVLAPSYPTAPAAPQRLVSGRPSRWGPGDLYTEVMFHGPSWQGVVAIDETSASGTVATLRVLPVDGFFQSMVHPQFVLDPVTLDAAGQVIGFWTMERLTAGNVIFPFRLERLDLYGPQRAVGEAVTCVASIQLVGEQLVRSDIDLIGADGNLWMRLTGWEDKRFDLPDQFHPLMRASRQEAISSVWPEPLAQLDDAGQLECRRVAATFPADRAFWKLVWAQRILSRREREVFRHMQTPEHRQMEWLAGRTAAKEAVQGLLRARYGLELLPADIEILPDEQGCPRVGGIWQSLVTRLPVVSLAHTGGIAVALAGLAQEAAGDGRLMVGIDIEFVKAQPDSFAAVAFDDREQQLLMELPSELRDEWVLRCWCAKEAVAKALGTGLVEGPRSAAVTAVDLARGQIAVRPVGRLAEQHPNRTDGVVACPGRHDDIGVAVTLGEPVRPWAAAVPNIGAPVPEDRRISRR